MLKRVLSFAVATMSMAASATLVPSYTTFGELSDATFGGTGINNSAVAITTLNNGAVTLGLTAVSRYFNLPPVSNDGAGRFFATTGVDQTDATSIAQQYAKWNYAFYVGGEASAVDDYTYQLLVDVDPTAGELFKVIGPQPGPGQDSWNLGMAVFETAYSYSFDPTVAGEYSFVLQALAPSTVPNGAPTVAGSTSIVVQVVPEPGTLALVGAALAGIALSRRRRT